MDEFLTYHTTFPLNDAWIVGRIGFGRRQDGAVWIHMAEGDTEEWRPICSPIGVFACNRRDDGTYVIRVHVEGMGTDYDQETHLLDIPRSALADPAAVLAQLYAKGLRTVGPRGEDFVIEMLKAVNPKRELATG
jgi:hypothetical protein